MDVGSQASYSSDDTPKGIWTGAGGADKVVANGDININGSRIGTFDGGDVWVESTHGKVDAGQGGRTISPVISFVKGGVLASSLAAGSIAITPSGV